jgi:hypothetical protein
LRQQSRFTFCHKEHLILAKIAQLLGGFSTTDATLVTTQAIEEAF